MAFDFLSATVNKRAAASLLRLRRPVISHKDGIIEINGQHYLNFASNDYLGLSQHESVLQAYVEGLAVYGSGSGGSSVVTGYSAEHKALEDDICEVINKPAAMLFSSGFAANQALCDGLFGNEFAVGSTIANTNSTNANNNNQAQIVCDKYMHASFIQGAQHSQAKLKRFKHNDMTHALSLISNMPANSMVASEGIFSMDGDQGAVAQLQSIIASLPKSQTKPWLMLDEAHAFGVIGKNGFGSLDCDNVDGTGVDIVMGTFGKALGNAGAFLAGSHDFVDYMVNTNKHYIYSTAISGAQARAIRAAIALVSIGIEREKLHQNINYFVSKAKGLGLPLLPSKSAIQPIIMGDPALTLESSKKLAELGLWVPAIRTPTVPKNTDRLRVIINALHSQADIDALLDGLSIVIHTLPFSQNPTSGST